MRYNRGITRKKLKARRDKKMNYKKEIREKYAAVVEYLAMVEKRYKNNKKSRLDRDEYYYISGVEEGIRDIAARLGVALYNDDLEIIKE